MKFTTKNDYTLFDKQTLNDAIISFKNSDLQELPVFTIKLRKMKFKHISFCLKVLNIESKGFIGLISQKNVLSQLNKGKNLNTEINQVLETVFQVKSTTSLAALASIFNTTDIIYLSDSKRLVTRLDILTYINSLQ